MTIFEKFKERFSYASFTWNGNDATGEKCAKQTKRSVESFFRHELDAAIEGMKRNDSKLINTESWRGKVEGYNQALEDLRNRLGLK